MIVKVVVCDVIGEMALYEAEMALSGWLLVRSMTTVFWSVMPQSSCRYSARGSSGCPLVCKGGRIRQHDQRATSA